MLFRRKKKRGWEELREIKNKVSDALEKSGDVNLKKKFEKLWEHLENAEWSRMRTSEDTAKKLARRYLDTTDTEALITGIRYAEIFSDPRATLGFLLFLMNLKREKNARKVLELIDRSENSSELKEQIGKSFFTHQSIHPVPGVGMGRAFEIIASAQNKREDVTRVLDEIKRFTLWEEEIRAIVKENQAIREMEETLRRKGASDKLVKEMLEEKRNGGLSKELFKWKRKKE